MNTTDRRTVTPDALNSVMEFDHVIRVHEDGSVTDEPNIFAPELLAFEGGELEDLGSWELLDGYSGQHGYSGPIMHNSEYIGGGMADDILSTPGVYVALVCTWLDTPEDEDNIEGWAVARLVES